MEKLNSNEINMVSGGCRPVGPDPRLFGDDTRAKRKAESAKKCRKAMTKGIPVN